VPKRALEKFQKDGIYFLFKFWDARKNVIFSDEKGLGKKVTVVSFLRRLQDEKGIAGPFLIIGQSKRLAEW
jgi:SNF2 family DNA or RNA helicase